MGQRHPLRTALLGRLLQEHQQQHQHRVRQRDARRTQRRSRLVSTAHGNRTAVGDARHGRPPLYLILEHQQK